MSSFWRFAVGLVPAGIGAGLAFAVLGGLGTGTAVAVSISSVLAVAAAALIGPRLPPDVDDLLRRPTFRAGLCIILGVGAVVSTARVAGFMADETKSNYAVYAFDDFFVHHSCLSAYFQAAKLHRSGTPNVYERTLYEGPSGEPQFIGSLVIDTFLYPPPFLLLARLGFAISEDFTRWRAVWFGLEGALVGVALLTVGRWIGGPVGRRAAVLSILVWFSVPNLMTLQFGNFHLVAITGSVLAMVAFERGRHALGGAALAALALLKIFPGILVLFLLFQRRWRSLAWTCGCGLVLLIVSYAVLGAAPFAALVSYHLPRLSTGDALESLFAHPDVIAANQSVFGLVQKLSLLGVPGASQSSAAAVAWVYGLALVGVAAIAARVAQGAAAEKHLNRAVVWLTLVQLASLRAPFTPDTYALFAPVWIAVLLLANDGRSGWRTAGLGVVIVLGNFVVPALEIMPLTWLLVVTSMHQMVFLTLCGAIIVHVRRSGTAVRVMH